MLKPFRKLLPRTTANIRDYDIKHYEMLNKHILFDKQYYRSQSIKLGINIDIEDTVEHYLTRGDALRIPTHILFNTFCYHWLNPDLEGSGLSALVHYILHGSVENRNPHPLFDAKYVKNQITDSADDLLIYYLNLTPGTINPHPLFDEKYVVQQIAANRQSVGNALITYLRDETLSINPSRKFDRFTYREKNPDTIHMEPLEHYVLHGRQENRLVYSVEASLVALESQIEEAAGLEYDLFTPYTDIHQLKKYHSLGNAKDLSALFGIMKSVVGADAVSHAFLLPHIEIGGAEKVLVNILEYLISKKPDEQILIMITDSSHDTAINWIPKSKNVKIINLFEYGNGIEKIHLIKMLGIFFQVTNTKNIYSLNSSIGWKLFEYYGRPLSSFARLHGFAFCYDFDHRGRKAGYAWTHLPHCISNISNVITDNHTMIDIFSKDMRLSQKQKNKFFVLRQPISVLGRKNFNTPSINQLDRRASTKKILWAGRFHKQKNIITGIQIANLLPEYNFIFAGGFSDHDIIRDFEIRENMTFVGPYNGFASLLSHRADLFLHTADWDGIPNVLLEAAAASMPIVARAVGGVPDLVTPERGWLAAPSADAQDFSIIIRKVFADEKLMREKITAMNNFILSKHSWDTFSSTLDNYYK